MVTIVESRQRRRVSVGQQQRRLTMSCVLRGEYFRKRKQMCKMFSKSKSPKTQLSVVSLSES